MSFTVTIHFNNSRKLKHPRLWYWTTQSGSEKLIKPKGEDEFGYFFEVTSSRFEFNFKFRTGIDTEEEWEDDSLNRLYTWNQFEGEAIAPTEIWCTGDTASIYYVKPGKAEKQMA